MNETKKGLSLFALIMIAIGATIGSGIFKTPSGIAAKVSDNSTILMLWVLGGVVSLLGALVFAEMGSRFSNAGGIYAYLNKAYGPLPGFLYGWCLLTVISSGTIAALCIVFAENLNYFLGLDASMNKYLAMVSIVVLTLFNTFGIKTSEWFANIGTILKIIGIYALLIIALVLGEKTILGHVDTVAALPTGEGDKLAAAFVGVLWSYTGWHYASFVSGDASNPKRNIPLAMIIGTGVVTLTYVLCNMGYMKVFDHNTLASFADAENPKVAAVEAIAVLTPKLNFLMPVLIGLSVFAAAGLYVLSTPRIFNQMAKEGLFFQTFAKEHPKFKVPVNAIILQSAWAMVLVMLSGGLFSSIIEYVTFIEWLFLLLACIGIFLIRRKYPNDKPAFKTPFYPILPLVFIAIIGWFIVNNAAADKVEYYAGLLVIPIGVLVFYLFKSLKVSN